MEEYTLLDAASYRPCVGAVILNDERQIFMARRRDLLSDPPHAWQMPQGGIDEGETPFEAVIRELEEEIGTSAVTLISETAEWLYYDFPENVKKNLKENRFAGQRQKWFLFAFTGTADDINLDTKTPEFSQWRWGAREEIIREIIPFKRQVYEQVFAAFAPFLGDPP